MILPIKVLSGFISQARVHPECSKLQENVYVIGPILNIVQMTSPNPVRKSNLMSFSSRRHPLSLKVA